MTDLLAVVLAVLVLLAVLWLLLRTVAEPLWLKRQKGMVTVFAHQTGLRYIEGRFDRALPPGRYSTWPRTITIETVELRPQLFGIPNQEALTRDSLPVRASYVLRWRTTDAAAFKSGAVNAVSSIYETAQIALRKRIAAHTLDEILADRDALTKDVAAEVAAKTGTLGVAIEAIDLKDLTLVGPAKQAYADLWKAQKEGLASLERARGEQAALRALANAARMLKGNPELMNLRVLAALSGQPGRAPPTIILGGAPGLVPVSPVAGNEPPPAKEE